MNLWKENARLRYCFYIIGFVLALIQAWGYRHALNTDGLSYLDIAYNYLNGNYEHVVNTYWFPFYIWLIWIVLFIFKPTPYWEFSLLHGLNLVLFIISFIAFDYFFKEFMLFVKRLDSKRENKTFNIPDHYMMALGYTVFIWVALKFVTVWVVSPDMLLSIFLYVAYGILLSINRGPSKKKFYILGFVLGLGYLVKPTMLWLGFFFFIGALMATNDYKKHIPTIFAAIAIFLCTLSPYVYVMSKEKNRLTFADNGKLMVLWEINQVKPVYMVNWQGTNPEYGTPDHPSRKIHSSPDVYEFATPISGSYPLWYDPTYWHEGAKPKFNLQEAIKPFKKNYKDYISIYIALQGILLLGAMYLLLLSTSTWKILFKSQMFFLLPSFAGLALISIILPELRYLSAFVVTVWLAIYNSISLPEISKRLAKVVPKVVVGLLLIVSLLGKFYPSDFSYLGYVMNLVQGKEYYDHENYYIYKELKNIGIADGQKVACVGHGHLNFWAHLGRHKIVAEIPLDQLKEFWESSLVERNSVYQALSRHDVKFILAFRIPEWANKDEWTELGNTKSYIHYL